MTYTQKDIKFLKWSAAGARIFSTCSKAQYMAIVVDVCGRVVGIGYNGSPPGTAHCVDGGCPRAINNVPSGAPYDYGDGLCVAVHAEPNALLYSDATARRGGTIYVGGVPCFGCSKLIATSGVNRVVYVDNGSQRSDTKQALYMMSNLELVPVPEQVLHDDFDPLALLAGDA